MNVYSKMVLHSACSTHTGCNRAPSVCDKTVSCAKEEAKGESVPCVANGGICKLNYGEICSDYVDRQTNTQTGTLTHTHTSNMIVSFRRGSEF